MGVLHLEVEPKHYIDHGKLGVASGEGFYRYDNTPN